MLRSTFAVLVLLVSLVPLRAAAEEWRPLFNGKDLSGWTAGAGSIDNWGAEEGILFCKGGGGGWISTADEYANFELMLEFRVPSGGNSGVFLRAPHKGDPAYTGMEVQVLDDHADRYARLRPDQYTGSIYGVAAPSERVTKQAGEWQKMHIVCDGRRVRVTLNGTEIVDENLDDHEDKFEKHSGLTRTAGYIGLQNHGSRLDYRNINIRVLP